MREKLTPEQKLKRIESQLLASIRGKQLCINYRSEIADNIRQKINNPTNNDNVTALKQKLEENIAFIDAYYLEKIGLREATALVLDIICDYQKDVWSKIFDAEDVKENGLQSETK